MHLRALPTLVDLYNPGGGGCRLNKGTGSDDRGGAHSRGGLGGCDLRNLGAWVRAVRLVVPLVSAVVAGDVQELRLGRGGL